MVAILVGAPPNAGGMHLSIYARAILLIGVSLALITVLATGWSIRADQDRLSVELRARAGTLAEQQAVSLSKSLWDLNREGALIVLQGAETDPDFLAATVLDDRGRSFVHLGPAEFGDTAVERARAPIYQIEGGHKQEIGTVDLVFSLARLAGARQDAALRALLLGLAQLAAVLGATAVALYSVTKPLRDLTRRMLGVTEGRVDESVPHLGRRDQIGDIANAVEAFRVEAIKRAQAERELQRAYESLERRVEERTRELSASEQRLRGVMDNVTEAIVTTNDRDAVVSVNLAAERIFGCPAGELIGRNVAALVPDFTGPARGRPSGPGPREVSGLRKDGTKVPLDLSVSEMQLGLERRFIGVMRDVSDRKESERQLLQAQKMEAVGQLTGGIAHDFNNLLTVIIGNVEMLAEALEDKPDLKRLAAMSSSAADRAAELTRSLLAFSREQVLEPEVTDVGVLIVRIEGLLRRAIGEQIEVVSKETPDVWQVFVDPGKLEAAILNLAVNARDAMPNGGRLTIATSNTVLEDEYVRHEDAVAPGDYVQIAVSDTGTGMPPEVLARAFDPFFTTKEVGKGSGLGLSMVYGFAKQSGGHVKIYSEVGHGTSIKIYLPRAMAPGVKALPSGGTESAPGGTETILLVEDDATVRAYVEQILARLGYTVHSAQDGVAALEILRQGRSVDLLFTDVVMPGGLNGPQLSAEARKLRPALRVLFTSGYTEDAFASAHAREDRFELLSKPYRRGDLAAKLRKVLDAAQEPAAAPSG